MIPKLGAEAEEFRIQNCTSVSLARRLNRDGDELRHDLREL